MSVFKLVALPRTHVGGARSLRRWWWRGTGILPHMAVPSASSVTPPPATSWRASRSQLKRKWLLVRHCAPAVKRAQMPTTCPPLWSWSMVMGCLPTRRCHGVPEASGHGVSSSRLTALAQSILGRIKTSEASSSKRWRACKLWPVFPCWQKDQIHQLIVTKCHHWNHVTATPKTILDVSCLCKMSSS